MNKFIYENTALGKKASGYVEEVGAVEVATVNDI